MSERHADVIDRITAAAVALWRQHERQGSVVAVAHVTRALPALGRLNGCLEGIPLLRWLCLQARDARGDARASAIKALGHIGESLAPAHGPEPLSIVVEAISDQDLLVRVEAAEALRRIGSLALSHGGVLSALTQATLHDPDGLSRAGAARALEQLRGAAVHDKEVRATIDAALLDDTPQVRSRAQRLRQQLDDAPRQQPVARIVDIKQEVPSREAPNMARQPGNTMIRHSEEILNRVKTALNDTDPLKRAEAVKTLEQVNAAAAQHSEAFPILLHAMHADDGGVRSRAIKLLKTFGLAVLQRGETLSALKAVALHDRNSNIRAEAAETLGLVGEIATQDPGVLITLVHGVKYDKDGKVRACAAGALGQLGRVAAQRSEPLTALVAALHDEDDEVRYRAAEALGRIMSQGIRLFRRWWRKVEGKRVEELARL
jgi:HEAT repeat protein